MCPVQSAIEDALIGKRPNGKKIGDLIGYHWKKNDNSLSCFLFRLSQQANNT